MSTTILTNARKDRASTLEEIGEELRRTFGDGARLDVIQPPGRFAAMLAMVTVVPTAHDIVDHEITGEAARLEWWQRDNHLIGVGFGHGAEEAADRALAMARRGDFSRRNITTWCHRASRKYQFFIRSRRDSDRAYAPVGRELSAADFETLTV